MARSAALYSSAARAKSGATAAGGLAEPAAGWANATLALSTDPATHAATARSLIIGAQHSLESWPTTRVGVVGNLP